MRTTLILIILSGCGGSSTRDAGFPSKQSVEPRPAAPTAAAPTPTVERAVTRETLVQMFDRMQTDSGWDPTKPLLWGYFFFDSDRSQLEVARRRLEADGYEYVSISDPEVPTNPFVLHVQKVEIHSVDSLLARSEAFYDLAEELGLDSYDGMDVGLVEPAAK